MVENGNSASQPAVLTINNTAGATFSGTIRDGASVGAQPLGLAVNPGAGNTFTLTGNNSFTGTATVASGTLQGSGASLSGPINLVNANANVTFDQAAAGTYANVVSGNGSLTKTGPGALAFGGVSPSTYSGVTSITGGTLQLGVTSNGPAPTVQNASFEAPDESAAAGGFETVSAMSPSHLSQLVWAGQGAVFANGSAWGFNNVPDGSQGFSLQNVSNISQTLNFATPGTYTLSWSAANRPNYTANPAALPLDGVLVDSWSATGDNNWSSFTCNLTIPSAGIHTITFEGTTPASSGDYDVAIDNIGLVAAGTPTASASLPITTTVQLGATSGVSPTLDLNGASQQVASLANVPGSTVMGTIVNTSSTPSTLTLNAASGASSFSGVISAAGGGTINLVMAGGVQTLSGLSTYTGTTTISGGTLGVTSLANGGAASPLGASTVSAGNLVLNGGALQYSGSGAASTNRLFTLGPNGGGLDGSGTANGTTDGSVSFTATGAMAASGSGPRTLTLTGTNTGNNTLAAKIADASPGAVALQKTGAGTWVLTGANTYSGGTTIGGGTLLAANSSGSATGSGSVTVGSTGVLGGSGSVGGPVEVQNLGHLAPSANVSAGLTTLTLGNNLTLDPGSNLDLDLGPVGGTPAGDMIVVGGNLSLPTTGTVSLNMINAGGFGPGAYDVLNYPTGKLTTGSVNSFTFNGPSGTAFQYSVTDQTISGGMDELVLNVIGTNLVWTGGAGGNGDWLASGLWNGSTFQPENLVSFGNLSGAAPTVTINSSVQPYGVTFSNTSATSYTIDCTTGALTARRG